MVDADAGPASEKRATHREMEAASAITAAFDDETTIEL
jgi:hypothetical protein